MITDFGAGSAEQKVIPAEPRPGRSPSASAAEAYLHQRLKDNNEEGLAPLRMFEELRADNQQLTIFLRQLHEVCERHNDVATASLTEIWVDETERRAWFLSETLVDLRQLQTEHGRIEAEYERNA